jgi:cytochrome c oxidase subunit IV
MQHPAFEEVTVHHEHIDDAAFKKKVRSTTILLSVITIIELAIGLIIYSMSKSDTNRDFLILAFKGVVCILTLAKAYYIVSVFMHLGDEIRNFIMTIIVPLSLFIWFIAAFIWDGNSYKNLRNKYDRHFKETTMPSGHHGAEKQIEKPATAPSGKE